jgi:hypothetical protein
MTEAEWLAATDPMPMIEFLRGKASDRKLRLFAVACCRRVWHRLTHQRSRAVVVLVEAFADGEVGEDQVRSARDAIWQGPKLWPTPWAAADADSFKAAWFTHQNANRIAGSSPGLISTHHELLREVVGNPWRSIAFDPSWRTEAVVGLARGMYESRDFAPMPVLADALEDAGCADADILAHCRGDGPHVRGCWVVDLVLGKS